MGIVDVTKEFFGRGSLPNQAAQYSAFRPSELDYRTRGVEDVAKMPTMPYIGVRFAYQIFAFSDVLRTIVKALIGDTFRNDIQIIPRFAVKCTVCQTEYKTIVKNCEYCGSPKLRQPDKTDKKILEKFLEVANLNGQSLLELSQEIALDLNVTDNMILAVVKEYYFDEEGKVIGAKPREILRTSPENFQLIMDRSGRPAMTDDGRAILFCLKHRNKMQITDYDKIETSQCNEKDCNLRLYPAYYRIKKWSYGRYDVYYTQGEMIHKKKWWQGIGYGLSPVWAIWMKVMILMKQDFFVMTAYNLARPPKGVLIIKGNRESIEKAWRKLQEENQENPHMIYPLIVENINKDIKNVMEWLDLTYKSTDVDFIQYRDEVRRTMGALYGVMPIFGGDVAGAGGLANEGLQIVVTSRAVEQEQGIFNNLYKWLAKQLGASDWIYQLVPHEGRDEAAKLQRGQMRGQLAVLMKNLGYEPIAKMTEDGLDFDYMDPQTGSQIDFISSNLRVVSSRRIQGVDGAQDMGRPAQGVQRMEGDVTGDVRQPKTQGNSDSVQQVGVTGEGGVMPTKSYESASKTIAEMKEALKSAEAALDGE